MMLPTLVVRDPELIKQITVKDFEYFLAHRFFVIEGSDPLWSKNLFSLKGKNLHQEQSQILVMPLNCMSIC